MYVLKFICALMVVQIHTPSFAKELVLPVCRIAVPIFFMISGYFLVNKDGRITETRLISTFKKVFAITLTASAVYLVYHMIVAYNGNHSIEKYMSIRFWMHELVFGDYINFHLWYLVAYLQALTFLYIAIRIGLIRISKFSIINLIVVITIGLSSGLILGRYTFLISDHSIYLGFSRNMATISLPFILVGVLLRIYEHRLPSQQAVVRLISISLCFLYAEELILRKFHPNYGGDIILMTIPLAILTFLLFLRLNVKGGIFRYIGNIGKKHTLDIYIWHPLLALFLIKGISQLGWTFTDRTLVVFIFSVIFSIVLNSMSKLHIPIKIRKVPNS